MKPKLSLLQAVTGPLCQAGAETPGITYRLCRARLLCAVPLGIGLSFSLAAAAADSAGPAPARTSAAIPWSHIGAKAGVDYRGDGLAVIPTADGARLRCVFQRLEGEATREGLWLTSTVTNAVNDRFRVVVAEVGRATTAPLPNTGTVSIDDQTVRFTRLGLVEEYGVTMDGVRQDFLVLDRPDGAGELVVRLAVSGARAETAPFGARLVLKNTGRKIAYSRLRVTDATGRELTGRMEVVESEARRSRSLNVPEAARAGAYLDTSERATLKRPEGRAPMLAVLVRDANAVYPVRIDPTFSDENWISMGGIPGADATVEAAVVDGTGNLYIGGSFTVVGEVTANRVARWNGSNWSALGSGVDDSVRALAVSGSEVYAGGWFTTAGGNAAKHVAKWDGSGWSALGSGLDDAVYALALSGSDLYAGGWFKRATNTGGTSVMVNGIAKWDGGSWSAVGLGLSGPVGSLAVLGSNLYVGGAFTRATNTSGSTLTVNNIAKWNGTAWSALGAGLTDIFYPWRSEVCALAVLGSDLYAGGYFTKPTGGGTATNVAKWNGNGWSALGSGIGGGVIALAVSGGQLYAGGIFETAGGVPANNIAAWNGSHWSALGPGMTGQDGHVYALAVSGSNLFAGGSFTIAGGNAANEIAQWNGNSWLALGLGTGINGSVSALAVSGSDLYAGGQFTMAGGVAANYIAKWNGNSWAALSSGMGGVDFPYISVYALAMSGSDVYVGGNFTTAGGSAANYIAKWSGNSWSTLGSGLNNTIYALAVSGSDLVVGGRFTMATNTGGTSLPVNCIARWDGSSWSALASGMSGSVYALAVSGSDLYAGGDFTTSGGNTATNVAKWNGSSWSPLGSGIDGWVYALAVSGTNLYVGGLFTMAGGVPAKNIAKWDGSAWSTLDSGVVDPRDPSESGVEALAVSGSDLYAGGYFTTAGGVAANKVAKWDGSSWSALGSGMSGPYPRVCALVVAGSDLYAGGNFTAAGGRVSTFVARAYLLAPPTLSVLRSGTQVMVSWPSTDTADFALEQTGTLAASSGWVTNSLGVTDDGTNKAVTLPATNSLQFFRLRRP